MYVYMYVCMSVCVHATGSREAGVFGNHPRKKKLGIRSTHMTFKRLSSETHLRFCRVNLTRQLLVRLAAWAF